MTNFEKYKDEIMDISIKGRRVALVKRQPVDCHNISCTACDLYCEVPCDVERLKWLYEEYKEPAPTLTSKERAFCETVSVYPNRYIARDKDGMLKLFFEEPIKISHLWDIDSHGSYFAINETLFPFIKWKDEEPWSIEDLLKLEVRDND